MAFCRRGRDVRTCTAQEENELTGIVECLMKRSRVAYDPSGRFENTLLGQPSLITSSNRSPSRGSS